MIAKQFIQADAASRRGLIQALGPMYRVILACSGVPEQVGAAAACDIAEEFMHRPWHQNVQCSWAGSRLLLQADNDYDADGSALTGEFSDAIAACIAEGFNGSITVESVTALAGA